MLSRKESRQLQIQSRTVQTEKGGTSLMALRCCGTVPQNQTFFFFLARTEFSHPLTDA